MNAVEIQQEIARLSSDTSMLEAERAPFIEARDRALAAERFNHLRQMDVDNAQRSIDRFDQQIAAKVERIASISGQLPSEERRSRAHDEAKRLVDSMHEACAVFADRSADLVRACDQARNAAQAMLDARHAVEDLRARILFRRQTFGLELRIPAVPTCASAPFVQLTGMFILQAAEGEPDGNVRGELDAAKPAERARDATAKPAAKPA